MLVEEEIEVHKVTADAASVWGMPGVRDNDRKACGWRVGREWGAVVLGRGEIQKVLPRSSPA